MEQVIVDEDAAAATLLVVHKVLEDADADAARRSAPRTATKDEVTMMVLLFSQEE
jgi:hypothetical protein